MPRSDSSKLRCVLCIALISRIILASLISAWRYLAFPYDTSASINPPCLHAFPTDNPSLLLPRLGSAIEETIVWDAVYFVRIAECGYEYEHTYAFLPLLPLCMWAWSKTIFAPLVPIFGYRAVLGLSGYVLNNVAFLFAAVYLYKLSVLILKDSNVALRASALFCFNPASIFYSSMQCIRVMMPYYGRNVLMGVGFLRYFQMKQLPNFLLASPILCLAVCSIIKYTELRPEIVFSLGFRAPTEESSGSIFFPLGMGQNLKGTQPRAECSSLKSLREDVMIRQRKQKTGGESGSGWHTWQSDHEISCSTNQGYASVVILPFVLHMGFMTAVAFFVMHVQVSTRFLSASPPIFWFASYLMVEPRNGRRWGYLIWAYFTGYILLGSLLFSNFYPFT